MKELLKIEKRVIGTDEVNSVNARELWEQLESKQEFAHWVKKRLSRFIEGEDYLSFDKIIKRERGSTVRKEYILTIDTAKMIAMMENNERGDEVRKYFIEVEKRYKEQQANLSPAEILMQQAQFMLRQEQMNRQIAAKQEEHEQALNELKHKIDIKDAASEFSTVVGYCSYMNLPKPTLSQAAKVGKVLSKKARELGLQTGSTPDPRFGRVKTYPKELLDEHYGRS